MNKIIKLFISTTFAFLLFVTVAEAATPTVYFFRGEGCPHCAEEEEFFEQLAERRPDIEVKDFEVWYNRKNVDILKEVSEALDTNVTGVPFTVIGDKHFTGYNNHETSGKLIETLIEECEIRGDECPDIVGSILEESNKPRAPVIKNPSLPESIHLPLVGEVNPQTSSLAFLTIVIGGLDGFNPCAMWVLVLLISLLLGMKDRKRMWILGLTFIAASAFVYFVFMVAWLNFLLFLGFVLWVRVAIGMLALGGGAFNLREWWRNKTGVCNVTDEEGRGKILERARKVVREKSLWLALIGIIALAFSVNLIELVCSAGLPAVYTQILTLSDLNALQYYLYLLLYIFVFMLDDIIIFSLAMFTFKVSGLSTKYTHYSNLVGGILMVVLGILLIFFPSVLMFG